MFFIRRNTAPEMAKAQHLVWQREKKQELLTRLSKEIGKAEHLGLERKHTGNVLALLAKGFGGTNEAS